VSPVTRPEVAAILFTADEIAAAVSRLALRLALDSPPEPILLVGVLKGALFLTADLARAMPPEVDARLDYLAVSSYAGVRSSGEVRLLQDVGQDIAGKHVVLVDDILDSGLTLTFLTGLLAARKPASLRTCVLLDKPAGRKVDVAVDVTGLTCPDAYVVGYGLDYQEKYRNLPYLAKLDLRVSEG
jgi:hypoxanthine phosphoribosyltransferase